MPPRGRRPIPTHLKIIRGNTGRRPIPLNEPMPEVLDRIPDPPEFLAPYARDEWHRIADELQRLNLLTIVDIHPLAAYCQAYATWRMAEETLADMRAGDPRLRGFFSAKRANPLVGMASKAASDMVKYAAEFGLTPSARARLAAGPFGGDGSGKFKGLLGG